MDVFERIKNSRDNMSKSFIKVADFVCENYESIAFMSVGEVARKSDVSESVVVRFAGSLGYKGFAEMKRSITVRVKDNLDLPRRMMDIRLSADSPLSDVMVTSLHQDIDNIKATQKNPYNYIFADVVKAIREAKHVYIMGSRGLNKVAELAAFLFDLAGIDSYAISADDSTQYQRICRMDAGSVFIALSLPRYNMRLDTAAQIAQEHGAKIVVICDNLFAPIARRADYALLVSVKSNTFINSYASLIALINAIVTAVGIRYRDETITALEDVEGCIQRMRTSEE